MVGYNAQAVVEAQVMSEDAFFMRSLSACKCRASTHCRKYALLRPCTGRATKSKARMTEDEMGTVADPQE